YGPRMDCEEIQVVSGKDSNELLEHRGRVETKASLHRELGLDGVAQSPQDRVHKLRLAQQASTGAFAVDHRRGAAKIQIPCRYRILLQLARGSHERGNVIANHLRGDRLAGRIFRDRFEDRSVEGRSGMDAEILGKVEVRTTVGFH